MHCTIEDRAGRLAIVWPWDTSWDAPERRRHIYATGLRAADYPHLVGIGCDYIMGSDGLYGLPAVGFAATRYIRADNGRDAIPIEIETEPVVKPRGRGRWAWRSGKWDRA